MIAETIASVMAATSTAAAAGDYLRLDTTGPRRRGTLRSAQNTQI